MLGIKVSVWVFLGLAIAIGSSYFVQDEAERNRDVSLQQLDDTDASARAARVDHWARNQAYAGAMACWAALGFVLFASDVRRVRGRPPARWRSWPSFWPSPDAIAHSSRSTWRRSVHPRRGS